MANTIGTSIGLQGQYKNDYLENMQVREQQRANLANEALRRKAQQDKTEADMKNAISDAVKIEHGKYLPQRNKEMKDDGVNLLLFAINKQKNNPSYNPEMDEEFVRKKADIEARGKSYEMERIRAEKDMQDMAQNELIYDKRAIAEGLSVLSGQQEFTPAMRDRLYQVPKVKDFSSFTDLGKHIENAQFLDTENKEVEKFDSKGNKYIDVVKGYAFGTPEKEKEQYQKTLEYVKSTRDNPYIQRLVADAEKQFIEAAPSKGIVLEKMPNEVFNNTVDDLVAKKIIETAKNDIDNKTKDIERKAPSQGKGLNINNTIGGGGVETPDGVFIPKETPLLSNDAFKKQMDIKKEEAFTKWAEAHKAKYPKSEKTDEELKVMHKQELSKPSKNNPKLSIEQWNEQQARKEADNAKQGLTAISFTPKGKDNWFEATSKDGKIRKIIPKTIYKNDKGELVKVEGYNVDESTGDVKIDLEEFEVDTKNEDNRNSFIGKYPTSVKSVGLNIPTNVVVSGKQGVGTIQGKAAVPKVKTQDEFNKAWANLKKGESIVAPNGQTYKKK